MKPWIGCEIRLVRSQLGWSRVQLAKHLGCSPLKVVKMESDELIPLVEEKAKLEALSLDIAEHIDGHQKRMQSDSLMEELGIEQIHIDDMDDESAFRNFEVDN